RHSSIQPQRIAEVLHASITACINKRKDTECSSCPVALFAAREQENIRILERNQTLYGRCLRGNVVVVSVFRLSGQRQSTLEFRNHVTIQSVLVDTGVSRTV